MSHTVKVHTTSLQSGCHIDGSHWAAHDFNIAVVGRAQSLGMEVKDTERAFLDRIESEGPTHDTDYEYTLEMADAAEAWLNEHTEEGYVWHVDEQSLFLTDRTELED